jgi:hypothetical protein
MLAFLALTASALAAFPADAPNDPNYRPAEKGNANQTYPPEPADPGGLLQTCGENAADDEQHHHYAFMPQCTPAATDPYNAPDPPAAGMSIDSAWKDFTAGNAQTVIAYVEAGINWRNGDAEELRKRVFLNAGELPAPTTPVSDGQLNVDDFNDQAGPDDAAGNQNGVLDPEDLIVRFSDGVDDDANGYPDDISGWDFYQDQNDPTTVDSQYGHANGQMKKAAAEGDNATSGIGICPKCMLLPIKGGAEALDRSDDLAESWLYAADMNADVIASTTADLGYSTFMKEAVEYIWDQGTVMVESSNDFNSIDHQGGQFHEHVLPGNGMVANTHGIPGPETNAMLTTYNSRSGLTSWGTHNMFTGSTEGGSTSESTPTIAGVMALVLAYGKEAGLTDGPLSASEAIQVVRATAADIDDNPFPPNGWAGKPGFDLQYGYGRPNVHRAMAAIQAGDIPPEAWIDSPDWYSLHDPTDEATVPVTGHAAAPRSGSCSWELQFAPGAEPTDAELAGNVADSGSCDAPVDGPLGSIDLSQLPQSFWDAAQNPMEISQTKELETNDKYTVTLRLQVTDGDDRVGEERRAIAVIHDPSQRDGFPRKIGPDQQGGESQPVLADLQGTGRLAMVFGDSDGNVHAIDTNGSELDGFPVQTNPVQVQKGHSGVEPGHEPVIGGIAVGDLDHDGRQWLAATTTTGRTYVWDADGDLRSGWPRALDTGVVKPPIPRPDRPFTRDSIQGATASPVLVDMDGNGTLEVVQAGWDGRVHVFRPNGSDLPGWPVEAALPAGFDPPADHVLINDRKVDALPTIVQLDGDPEPELLVRSQLSFAPESTPTGGPGSPEVGGFSNVLAYNPDGSLVPGYPVSSEALIFYYGSAQEFITEGVSDPVAANVDDDPQTEWAFAPGIFSPTYLHESDGSRGTPYGPVPDPVVGEVIGGDASPATLIGFLNGNLPSDAPVNFTTSGAFGKVGPSPTLTFAEPGSGSSTVAASLILAGSGIPINNYMRVHDAASGANYPGFPAETQGLDFLGTPVIADVTGDGEPEVLEGGDSSVLHAFAPGGAQAAGFPKFQSGWILFAPATGDIDSDGKTEVVSATREGYLNVWNTNGTPEGNNEWWNPRHDERNTGQYGLDTRPPGIIRGLSLSADGSTVTFTSPGDDWYAGPAASYEIATSQNPITPDNFDALPTLPGAPAPAEAGTQQSFAIPAGAARYIAIRAIDDAGNRGALEVRDRGAGGSPGGGGSGGDGATGGGTGQASRKLDLEVKFKRPVAERRACFQIRATGSDGAPVANATVSLGWKSKLTGADGSTRICRRFEKPGKRSINGSALGFEADSVGVKVRRPPAD